jgi:periplasmic divalent cation tolerance protein
MTDKILIFTTAGSEKNAEHIAETLVNVRLAACVNVLPKVTSVYRWQEKVERAEEWLLVIKTSRKNFAAVLNTIKELHTYELPECVSVAVEDGSAEYLRWIEEALGNPGDAL